MNTEVCRAHQVAAGDQLWRSDEEGRGFVEAVAQSIGGQLIVVQWQDGELSAYRRNAVVSRAVRKS